MSRIRDTAYLVLGWFVLAACLAMFGALFVILGGCRWVPAA
jgi:hypothetical protein